MVRQGPGGPLATSRAPLGARPRRRVIFALAADSSRKRSRAGARRPCGRRSRALLKLDRALGADLRGDEPVLRAWPLPYEAMAWFLRHAPAEVFIGNPRVHFQHLAGRMNEPRREQRRWRIWACWGLARVTRPALPGDPKHRVDEPAFEAIAQQLKTHGLPGEAELWQAARRHAGA